MIYLFCGDDQKIKHLNYEKFMSSLSSDVEIFQIDRKNFNRSEIEGFYSGSPLFFNKCAIVFLDILGKEDLYNFIIDKLDLLYSSHNQFIFLEDKLDKDTLDLFKKSRTEINIFEKTKEKLEKFNNFILADALGRRDKLNLWIFFRQATDVGVSVEELSGILFWKVKDMILKKDFSKFSEEELKTLAQKISLFLPEVRKEGKDVEMAFEELILEAF